MKWQPVLFKKATAAPVPPNSRSLVMARSIRAPQSKSQTSPCQIPGILVTAPTMDGQRCRKDRINLAPIKEV